MYSIIICNKICVYYKVLKLLMRYFNEDEKVFIFFLIFKDFFCIKLDEDFRFFCNLSS